MPFSTPENARIRRPRNHLISTLDPKPRTQSLSQSSVRKPTTFSNNTNSCSQETKELLAKKPTKTRLFASLTTKGLGCGASSAPAVIRSAANWDAEKARRRKRTKKQRKTTSYCPAPGVSEVCCAPGVDVAFVVDPRARVYAEQTAHRSRPCPARRGASIEGFGDANHARSDASTEREFRRPRRHSPGVLPQIVMFQQNLLAGGSLDEYDQYGDWRLDVDSMSYEELLELSERIGYVGTGLREDQIFRCLSKTKYLMSESLPLLMSTEKDWKCSICQEGWKRDDKLGGLDCGHYHHLLCIKQWLLQKNACPVCKTVALADK